MGTYLARRMALGLVTLAVLTLLIFMLVRVLPGSAIYLLTADAQASREQIAAMERQFGLDRPVHVQYLEWVVNLARGDLGTSLISGQPVIGAIRERWPVTVELGLASVLLSFAAGLGMGVVAAIRQDTPLDYTIRSLAIFGLSVPNFWLGTLVLILLPTVFHWTPPLQWADIWVDPVSNLVMVAFPAAILALFLAAATMRMTRATVLETLRQDYVRTARAKGLYDRVVLVRHVLRNAMIPVLTIVGLQVVVIMSGSVIMETIFALPGLGSYLYNAALGRDYPAFQAVLLFYGAVVLGINLVIDFGISMLDPQVRLG